MLREPPYNDDGAGGWDGSDENGYSVTAVLRAELAPMAAQIDAAFIYGPLARGRAAADSDIDVIIIGRASFDEVIRPFIAAEKRLNRTIHPSVYRADEWRHKLASGNRVMLALMKQPKLFLFGTSEGIPQRT